MRMKYAAAAIALLLASAFASSPSAAQGGLELTPQFGYQWGGTQNYSAYYAYPYGGSIHLNANVTYGGTLSKELRPGYHGEISYHYQSTDLINRPSNGKDATLGTVSTQYIMLQGRSSVPKAGKTTPFLLGGVGTVGYSGFGTSYWYFAFDAGVGADIQVNEKVGIRLQTRALIPIQWFTTGVYISSGGSGVTTGGSTTLIQGDASIGITFKLGS